MGLAAPFVICVTVYVLISENNALHKDFLARRPKDCPKITFEAFRNFKDISPDKWSNESIFPRYRQSGRGFEQFEFDMSFSHWKKYRNYLQKIKEKEKAELIHSQKTEKMSKFLERIKGDISEYQSGAQQEIEKYAEGIRSNIDVDK